MVDARKRFANMLPVFGLATTTTTIVSMGFLSVLVGSSVFLSGQQQFVRADDGAYCCGPGWKVLGDIAFCDTSRPCCPGFEERVSMLPAVGLGLSCEREVGKRNTASIAAMGSSSGRSMRDVNNLSMLPWMRRTRSLADADYSLSSSASPSQLTLPPLSSGSQTVKSAAVVVNGHPQQQQNNSTLSKQVPAAATTKAIAAQVFEKLLLSSEDTLEEALKTGKQCRIVCS